MNNRQQNNNDDNRVNPLITFTSSLDYLAEARALLRENLSQYYRSVVTAANDSSKKILFFIDCDEATILDAATETLFVRRQIYESAALFKSRGGRVYALTSNSSNFIANHRAFTSVHHNLDTAAKFETIQRIYNREQIRHRGEPDLVPDPVLFVFAGFRLIANIAALRRDSDVIVDVSGDPNIENDPEDERESYSVVDYILYYLTIVRYIRRMNIEALAIRR